MSEEKKTTEEPKKEIDKELSELLDSALEDFSKESEKKTAEKKEDVEGETEEVEGDPDWSEEFLRQAAQQFESNIGQLLQETTDNTNITPEQIQQSFQRMAEAAQQVLTSPEITDSSTDFSAAISQTLRGLNEGAENLQTPFSEQDFFNMFGGGGGGAGATGEQNGFLPFMQGMMQSLLSKEVLYPSLKDILEKFPEWLQENESKITSEEKERYQNQQKLMDDVCKELEGETEADSADVKRQRFEKVLSLMQKLQDYGQPPADLVGDVGSGIQFDPQGNPEQCCLM